jgi:hypothetical protein
MEVRPYYDESRPSVSGRRVVWRAWSTKARTGAIVLWEDGAAAPTVVAEYPSPSDELSNPVISGERIAWAVSKNDPDNPGISSSRIVTRLANETATSAVEPRAAIDAPFSSLAVNGDRIAYLADLPGYYDVWAYLVELKRRPLPSGIESQPMSSGVPRNQGTGWRFVALLAAILAAGVAGVVLSRVLRRR